MKRMYLFRWYLSVSKKMLGFGGGMCSTKSHSGFNFDFILMTGYPLICFL